MKPNPIRDLRQYSRQTSFRLIIGGVLLVLVIGVSLILIIYGKNAAIIGVICILLGLSPVLIIGIILLVMDWVIRRANRE